MKNILGNLMEIPWELDGNTLRTLKNLPPPPPHLSKSPKQKALNAC